MRARGPLAQVWSDLADLFSHEDRRFWFLFVAAILLQAGFWYLATPGPRLLALEVRLPENAVRGVLWTATLLLVIPFLLGTLLRFQPAETRLNAGKARFGIVVVLAVWAVSLPLLFFSADDRAIQLAYPWPGSWAGSTITTLTLWSGIYLLYYVAFEYFFRGFLLQLVAGKWGTPAGIWFQATAATLITLGRPLTEVLVALPLSILLGVLVVRSRSLLYPVVLHWLLGVSTDVFSLYHQKLFFP